MTRTILRAAAVLLACAATLRCGGLSGTSGSGQARLSVTSAGSSLVEQSLIKAAPAGPEATGFQEVPAPALRFRVDDARATRAPWVDSNAWRFNRGMGKASYAKLPAGTAPLAAAEAFTFDVDAILNPDPKDLEPLAKMLAFLKAQDQPRMPPLANIEVVDDQSPMLGEVLNLLTRRNLLYRVVPAAEGKLDVTVKVGSEDFPSEAAANPYDFAAKVRAKLGDDKRLVRLFGTSTTVARLTGDGKRARLYLLDYGGPRDRSMGGGDQQSVRVRVLGRYRPTRLAAYGAAAEAKLADVDNPGEATEFWLPSFATLAIVDLEPAS